MFIGVKRMNKKFDNFENDNHITPFKGVKDADHNGRRLKM
jgi:hypothetical protein